MENMLMHQSVNPLRKLWVRVKVNLRRCETADYASPAMIVPLRQDNLILIAERLLNIRELDIGNL